MRSSRRAVLRFALGVALVAAVFAEVVPRIASYGSVAHRLASGSAPRGGAVAVGVLLDILTTALPWQAVLPQLSFLGALAFTQASTALTTVLPGGAPLGMAISFGFLRRLRVDRGAAAFAVAVTGIWSQVMILVYPLVGALLVFATGQLSSSTAAIAAVSAVSGAVIVGLTVAALRSEGAAGCVGHVAPVVGVCAPGLVPRAPPNWSGEAFVGLRAERLVLLRQRLRGAHLATAGGH